MPLFPFFQLHRMFLSEFFHEKNFSFSCTLPRSLAPNQNSHETSHETCPLFHAQYHQLDVTYDKYTNQARKMYRFSRLFLHTYILKEVGLILVGCMSSCMASVWIEMSWDQVCSESSNNDQWSMFFIASPEIDLGNLWKLAFHFHISSFCYHHGIFHYLLVKLCIKFHFSLN